jgi:hypothetical protein
MEAANAAKLIGGQKNKLVRTNYLVC